VGKVEPDFLTLHILDTVLEKVRVDIAGRQIFKLKNDLFLVCEVILQSNGVKLISLGSPLLIVNKSNIELDLQVTHLKKAKSLKSVGKSLFLQSYNELQLLERTPLYRLNTLEPSKVGCHCK
jgi:hypothetical protein